MHASRGRSRGRREREKEADSLMSAEPALGGSISQP